MHLSASLSPWKPAGRQGGAILLAALVLIAPTVQARESVSISRDWRFTKGDPAGLQEDLRYDVRPPIEDADDGKLCLLYTSPSPRDRQKSRMPSSA